MFKKLFPGETNYSKNKNTSSFGGYWKEKKCMQFSTHSPYCETNKLTRPITEICCFIACGISIGGLRITRHLRKASDKRDKNKQEKLNLEKKNIYEKIAKISLNP